MSDWKTVRVRELCSDIIDCVNKTAPISDTSTKYKMLRTSDVRNGFINLENLNCVTEETFIKWTRRGKLQVGDVILTREAPLGEVGIVRCAENYFLGQRLVLFRTNPAVCDNRFLLYAFQFHDNKQAIISKGVGATVLHLRVPECERIEIKVPDLQTQKRIGDILSAYDDLIEANKKQIKLLEEAAQRLYKEWFVDLKFPGHEKTKIIDGVPEGWEKDRADVFFNMSIGKTPPRAEKQWFTVGGNGTPWISISDMGNSGTYVFNTAEALTAEAISKYKVKVVPEDTVLVSFKLTIGRVSITTTNTCTNEAIAHFLISDKTLREYTYFYLKCFEYDSLGNTSAISKAVNSKIIKGMPFVMPAHGTVEKFYRIAKPIFDAIKDKQNMNLQLAEARDRLLPKLMNGEIEV